MAFVTAAVPPMTHESGGIVKLLIKLKTERASNSIKMMDYRGQSFKVTVWGTIRWDRLSLCRFSHFLPSPRSRKHNQHHNLPHTLSSPRPLQKLNPVPPQSPLTRCKQAGLLQTVNHQHFQRQNHPAGLITTAALIIRGVFYFFLSTYDHTKSGTNHSQNFSLNKATHCRSNDETAGPDCKSNTGKLPVPLLHATGDFKLFLLYITTSLSDEGPAEIRERRTGRIGHKERWICSL